MTFHPIRDVHIRMPQDALLAIFAECDQFDDDETGGRILGTYHLDGDHLRIDVRALIDSGPRAQRSAVSFFQDGNYQEQVFRQIEAQHPEIEHLGNWHTHHMNGLQHLSSGDLSTYQRTVNHSQHNTPFFYALLVTTKHRGARDPLARYSIKHYLFRRNDPKAYEIPATQIEIVTDPLVSAKAQRHDNVRSHAPIPKASSASAIISSSALVTDQLVMSEFFPAVKPYQSAKLGLYWRGALKLANGENLEAVVTQDGTSSSSMHFVTLRNPPAALEEVVGRLSEAEFPSARAALMQLERTCNAALCATGSGWFKRKKK